MSKRVKQAKVTKPRPTKKVPQPSPSRGDSECIRFSFVEADPDQWSIHKITGTAAARLFKKLSQLELCTPGVLMGNHTMERIPIDRMSNRTAKARLVNQYEALDSIYEIRISKSGPMRLHGRLEGRFFSVIWWDPTHQVFPGGKNRK